MKLFKFLSFWLIAIAYRAETDLGSFLKSCILDKILLNPLITIPVSHGISKMDYTSQREEIEKHKRELFSERNLFYGKHNSFMIISKKLNMEIDRLFQAMGEMEVNMMNYKETLKATVQVYAQRDLPDAERIQIMQRLKRNTNNMNLVKFGNPPNNGKSKAKNVQNLGSRKLNNQPVLRKQKHRRRIVMRYVFR